MKAWIKSNGHWCNEEELGGKIVLAELSNNVRINGYCNILSEDRLELIETGKAIVTVVKACLSGSNNCYYDGNPDALFQLDKPYLVEMVDIKAQTASSKKPVLETQIYYKKDLIKLLGVSGMTLDRWSEAGSMPVHFMFVGRRAWLKKDIDDFIDDQVNN